MIILGTTGGLNFTCLRRNVFLVATLTHLKSSLLNFTWFCDASEYACLPTDDWPLWKCWGHSGNIKDQGSSNKAIDNSSSWIMWTITYWLIYFTTCVKYLKFHLPMFAHGQIALLCSTGWIEALELRPLDLLHLESSPERVQGIIHSCGNRIIPVEFLLPATLK